ncbi:biotin transporter BioY [Edaphobacter albus]|uniref:biotin transporter BioY n=1 Tax=Edaphobacter sp. 4G125 TaxID=2763071 RepID=UPI0016492A10|nr:biotin transporter BioY [Edaphobacter sp. 4G125]QNI35335.1 biotin transporter BioY [Edaphobacter sp. 4G125]
MQSTLSNSEFSQTSSRALPQSIPGRFVIAFAATLFVGACAHISIPLPFTPVPLTLQNFAVLLIGLMLGPVTGFSVLALYLAEGAMGLPVFNPQGVGGLAQIFGPTGGYLLSYPFAAAVAGWAFRSIRFSSIYVRAAFAGVLATFIIFSCGSLWLAQLLHLSASHIWTMAIAPFLPGEIVKVAAAAGLATSLHRWRRA